MSGILFQPIKFLAAATNAFQYILYAAPRKKSLGKKKSVKKRIVSRGRKRVSQTGLGQTKKTSPLAKASENPVIAPRAENNWEASQTFNPGVVLLDGTVHLLHRAIGEDGVSRLGYAASKDGIVFDERSDNPVYEHTANNGLYSVYSYLSGGSWGGAEDPRLVRVGDEDTLYMTYTACDNGLRVALTSISVINFLKKKWKWRLPKLISAPGEVHKNWLLFPEKIHGKYAILHSLKPRIQIQYLDDLEFENVPHIKSSFGGAERKIGWDKWLRGAGAPPIKTDKGWLLFYHAMDNDWSKYKVGAMLLDLEDPAKVLYRAKSPVLEPSEQYENNGFKSGVVYVSGAVVKDGTLFVYYGGADTVVCVASAPLDDFLAALMKTQEPKLKRVSQRLSA